MNKTWRRTIGYLGSLLVISFSLTFGHQQKVSFTKEPISNTSTKVNSVHKLINNRQRSVASIELAKFISIVTGWNHACGITPAGEVMCWGDNWHGQLGDGTTMKHGSPVAVIGLGNSARFVSAGIAHSCAMTEGGGVMCWGDNWDSQLGNGTQLQSNIPVGVIGMSSGEIGITSGSSHTCALDANGGVKCWGANWDGQLGDGTLDNRSVPVDVIGLTSGVSAIVAGGDHTCALTSDDQVKCWGWNDAGQLGDGTTIRRNTPVKVIGLTDKVKSLTAGGKHTCALLANGAVQCWGFNGYGQLGDGSRINHSQPGIVVPLSSGAIALAAGVNHTCALVSDGMMKCWGWNNHGQLGNNSYDDQTLPVSVVSPLEGTTELDGGYAYTCALGSGGEAKCWGWNAHGELGNNMIFSSSIPLDVIFGNIDVNTVSAGHEHTCLITIDNAVECWGENSAGQLGDGTYTQRGSPVDVMGLASGANEITAGREHSCSITTIGGIMCWGNNQYGQLGDNTTTSHNTPVNVIGLSSGAAEVSAGFEHTCALTSNGGVKCWGWNGFGQLGNQINDFSTIPVDVTSLESNIIQMTAGSQHNCALTTNGGIKCWGFNWDGQLGNGTTIDSNLPVDVIGLQSAVISVSAGENHSCALTNSGGVKCWGNNEAGQLGDGTKTDSSIPLDVIGLESGVKALSAGTYFSCAITADNGVKCWGDNSDGQLGNGSTKQSSIPVEVTGLSRGVASIEAGSDYACANVGSGRIKCWGNNYAGKLGIGTIIDQFTPVEVIEPKPNLTVNYPNGQPGSFITITGSNFMSTIQTELSINGQILIPTVTVNNTGSFIVFLDSSGADDGIYTVTASGYPNTNISFILLSSDPLREQEGGGMIFSIPGGIGIAANNFIYLPISTK